MIDNIDNMAKSRKGYQFELKTASLAGKRGKRIPRSGAIGTTEGIGKLCGDARWDLPWLQKTVAIECKHGYSKEGERAKSMTIQKEWFDKHLEQSERGNFYPVFAMKLKFAAGKDGLTEYMLIPFPVMQTILKEMENLYLEVEELRDEQKKISRPRT